MAFRLKRIGIFGGSFDPPHIGHLVIAEMARRTLRLGVVYLVPAYNPPHKHGKHPSTSRERLAMTRLSVRGNPRLRVSDLEVKRKGTLYTVDTVKAFHRRFPSARLFLIIGSDSLLQFHTWKSPDEILALSSLVVYPRPHSGRYKAKSLLLRGSLLEGPSMEISSSDIRKRVQQGKSIRYLVRDNVLEYLTRKKLYSDTTRSRRP